MGPDGPNALPPVYARGGSDPLDCLGADGCVPVPTGPGLGVDCGWAFVAAHRTAPHVFE